MIFVKNGKQLSPLENPLDTPKHCEDGKQWVSKNYGLLTCTLTSLAFLDKKWFYRVNRRRRSKYLSFSESDSGHKESVSKTKILSRRFPVKTMFMGIVGRP